jgi:hypothetical protein
MRRNADLAFFKTAFDLGTWFFLRSKKSMAFFICCVARTSFSRIVSGLLNINKHWYKYQIINFIFDDRKMEIPSSFQFLLPLLNLLLHIFILRV